MTEPVIFDGHNDTLLDLYMPERSGKRSFFEQSEFGHIDLPRARQGGLGGGFFAIFPPNPPVPTDEEMIRTAGHPGGDPKKGPDADKDGQARYALPIAPKLDPLYAQQVTLAMMAKLFQIERQSNGQVKVTRTAGEVEQCLKDGTIAVVLHFEGAEAIDSRLDALEVFYAAGLRSLGPVWSRANQFAQGVPFAYPSSPDIGDGLTEAGRRLVRGCNELGILVDLSHINEKGFWDVAELTDFPLVVTHAGAHGICPCSRNLTDEQIDAVGQSDGIIGVNFHVCFVREDGMKDVDTPLTDIVRHVDYMVERVGIDHVAFGSDFDGATMPQELGDASGLGKLMAVLRDRGYDEAARRKLAHENWLRVLRATWGE